MINVEFDYEMANMFNMEVRIKGHSTNELVCCAVSTLVQYFKTLSLMVGYKKVEVEEKDDTIIMNIPIECAIALKSQLKGIIKQYNADISIEVI